MVSATADEPVKYPNPSQPPTPKSLPFQQQPSQITETKVSCNNTRCVLVRSGMATEPVESRHWFPTPLVWRTDQDSRTRSTCCIWLHSGTLRRGHA
eukprot:2878976-Amphidinium_carterae.1